MLGNKFATNENTPSIKRLDLQTNEQSSKYDNSHYSNSLPSFYRPDGFHGGVRGPHGCPNTYTSGRVPNYTQDTQSNNLISPAESSIPSGLVTNPILLQRSTSDEKTNSAKEATVSTRMVKVDKAVTGKGKCTLDSHNHKQSSENQRSVDNDIADFRMLPVLLYQREIQNEPKPLSTDDNLTNIKNYPYNCNVGSRTKHIILLGDQFILPLKDILNNNKISYYSCLCDHITVSEMAIKLHNYPMQHIANASILVLSVGTADHNNTNLGELREKYAQILT